MAEYSWSRGHFAAVGRVDDKVPLQEYDRYRGEKYKKRAYEFHKRHALR